MSDPRTPSALPYIERIRALSGDVPSGLLSLLADMANDQADIRAAMTRGGAARDTWNNALTAAINATSGCATKAEVISAIKELMR